MRFLILCLSLLVVSTAYAQELAPGKEIVLFKAGLKPFTTSQSGFISTFSSRGNDAVKTLSLNTLPAGFTSTFATSTNVVDKVKEACVKLKAASTDLLCSPNFKVKMAVVPNDSYYSSTWGMPKIGAPAAWEKTTGSRSVKVAIVDTGIDLSHPDLVANLSINTGEIPNNGIDDDHNGFVDDVYGYDFANNDSTPQDDQGHGTHVSGTIGATGNNNLGVAGVNWQVGLIAVKALDSSGSGWTDDIADGIRYAVDRGANVINLSLGGSGGANGDIMYQAISYANAHGVLVAAAAGNESENNDTTGSFPANYDLPNIISVASSEQNDTLSDFSNYGASKVELAAPGRNIYSTIPGNKLAYYSGTSMATPHVTGAAALVKAAKPSLTMLQVKDLLLNNVDVLSSLNGKVSTSGRLNVGRAVLAAVGGTDTTPPLVPTPTPTTAPGSGGGDYSPSPGNPDDSNPGDDGDDEVVIDVSGKINSSTRKIELKGDVFWLLSNESVSTKLILKCKNARDGTAKSKSNGTFSTKLSLKKLVTSARCTVTAPAYGVTSGNVTVKMQKKKNKSTR